MLAAPGQKPAPAEQRGTPDAGHTQRRRPAAGGARVPARGQGRLCPDQRPAISEGAIELPLAEYTGCLPDLNDSALRQASAGSTSGGGGDDDIQSWPPFCRGT